MRRLVRSIALVLGIGLFVLFLSFSRDVTRVLTRDGPETREEFRIGAWFSPWGTWSEVRRKHAVTATDGGAVTKEGRESSWAIDLFSWSWPALLAGMLLIGWSRREARGG